MSDLIVNYLVIRKISRQYKIVIFSAIKHACEMNDIILNWKKLKKYRYVTTVKGYTNKQYPIIN